MLYGFFASDKLEPYVIVSVIGPRGRLPFLSCAQLDLLVVAIQEFKEAYGISDESYHYTPAKERLETDLFVREGGADRHMKAHSSHFHLKMRIATGMYLDAVKVLGLVDFAYLRKELEPVRYNYSRESVSFEVVVEMMKKDVR